MMMSSKNRKVSFKVSSCVRTETSIIVLPIIVNAIRCPFDNFVNLARLMIVFSSLANLLFFSNIRS